MIKKCIGSRGGIPLGELTLLPQIPSWIKGREGREKEGRGDGGTR